MNSVGYVPTDFTQNLAIGWLDCFWFFFSAHARHKTALITAILAANSALFGDVAVAITLTGESGLTIFCASYVKTLAGQADKSPKVVATGSLPADHADFEFLVLLRGTVVLSL